MFAKLGLLFVSSLVVTSAFAQVEPSRLIAKVNGDEIKGAEYYRRMEYLDGITAINNAFNAAFGRELAPGLLTLDRLITERLVGQLAKTKGVYPTDTEVNDELTKRIGVDPKTLENWKKSGRTEDELKVQIRADLATFKLQTMGVTVTDAEVDAYIKNNPERFSIPKQATLRVIVVNSAIDKVAVDNDLKSGKPFMKVAEERSVDALAKQGGAFGTTAYGKLPTYILNAIQKLKVGQTSDWVDYNTAEQKLQAKFLLEAVIPEQKEAVTPLGRQEVRRELMLMRGRVKNNLPKMMSEARKTAVIEIAQPEFAAAYTEFIRITSSTKTP